MSLIQLPTVLLEHVLPDGSMHYDWLLAQPEAPEGLLWTARSLIPSSQWQNQTQGWLLDVIPLHRREYLTYQGPLSPQNGLPRGNVRRVDEGWFSPVLWKPNHIQIDLHFTLCTGLINLHLESVNIYRASWSSQSSGRATNHSRM